MMKVWAVLLLPATLGAQFSASAVDALVQEAMRASGVPGAAVAVVRRDEPLLVKGYGVKQSGSGDAITPDTIFAIGSLTKAFTTTAIAIACDDGVINWDDHVRKHLPAFQLKDPIADSAVTLRDLVTHRTGLAGHDLLWNGAPWSLAESVRRMAFIEPSYPFRGQYAYQSILYNAAGFAMANACKTPWHEYVEKRIFRPLGMNGAKFTSTAARQAKDVATPHDGDAKPIEWYFDEHQIRPAGGLKMGIQDLSRWIRFNLGDGSFEGKPILSTRRLRELHSPQIVVPAEPPEALTAYTLGWVTENYRGHLVVTHGGGTTGFRSQLAFYPKDGWGIAVLTNMEDTWFQDALLLSLADLVLGLPKKDWNTEISGYYKQQKQAMAARAQAREAARRKDTKPSLAMTGLAGTYVHPAYGAVRVSPEGELWWSGFRLPLKHYHFDTFDVTGDFRFKNEAVTFDVGEQGRVDQMRFLGQTFKPARIEPRNVEAIADRLIGALRLEKGERVLIRHCATEFPGLVTALQQKISSRQASATLIADAASLPSLQSVDVFLWLPLGDACRQLRPEERQSLARWLDSGGKRRQIHFHWAEGSRRADGLQAPHTKELDDMLHRALDIDYAALNAAQDAIIAKLRRGTVRILTPAGTDIMFRTGVRTFNKQNGDASPERAAKATMRVDREIEFPAGVVRVAPIEESAHGVLVLPEMWAGDRLAKKVALYLDNGRITRIRAESGQQAVEEYLKADAAMQFREFGLGFNPKLTSPDDGLTIPYYGYGNGTVRISLGNNEELGGKVRGDFVRWFFLPDASVHIDNRYIVRNGRLVDSF